MRQPNITPCPVTKPVVWHCTEAMLDRRGPGPGPVLTLLKNCVSPSTHEVGWHCCSDNVCCCSDRLERLERERHRLERERNRKFHEQQERAAREEADKRQAELEKRLREEAERRSVGQKLWVSRSLYVGHLLSSVYKYWLVPRSTLKNSAPKLCNVAWG